MNREKHLRIVKRTIKRCLECGWSHEQTAEAIVNNMEAELEEEAMGQLADPIVADMDEIRKPQPELVKPYEDLLKPPQPVQDQPGKSLIIDPRNVHERLSQAAEAVGPEKALKALRLVDTMKADGNRKLWKQEQLRDFIEERTSKTIMIRVEGRKDPMVLSRNLEIMYGVDLVKLSYGIDVANSPTPSKPNWERTSDDRIVVTKAVLDPISINQPVFATFSCYEESPDIEAKVDSIRDQAALMYAPKPDHIDSHTPRRAGPLSYSDKDPHENTEPMKNPITGHVW